MEIEIEQRNFLRNGRYANGCLPNALMAGKGDGFQEETAKVLNESHNLNQSKQLIYRHLAKYCWKKASRVQKKADLQVAKKS